LFNIIVEDTADDGIIFGGLLRNLSLPEDMFCGKKFKI